MAKERNVNTTIELCAGDDRPIKVHVKIKILIALCSLSIIVLFGTFYIFQHIYFPSHFKVLSKFVATRTNSSYENRYRFKRIKQHGNRQLKITKGDRYLGGKDACKVKQVYFLHSYITYF